MREDGLPLKELCLHDLIQYTDLTSSLISYLFCSLFPCLGVTCSVFHVTKPCLLSGPFTFTVCLVSISFLLYLARGLLLMSVTFIIYFI